MYEIYLTENGHSGSFSARTSVYTAGTLSFRFSGPLSIVVDSLEVGPNFRLQPVAHKLLDALHEYAYYNNCRIRFHCPKARLINDQQIAQELVEILLIDEKAA